MYSGSVALVRQAPLPAGGSVSVAPPAAAPSASVSEKPPEAAPAGSTTVCTAGRPDFTTNRYGMANSGSSTPPAALPASSAAPASAEASAGA